MCCSTTPSTACATVRGTVLLGLVIRAVVLRWLRTANRPVKDMDITAQIAITICSSYLVFFTASVGSWPAVKMVMYRDHIKLLFFQPACLPSFCRSIGAGDGTSTHRRAQLPGRHPIRHLQTVLLRRRNSSANPREGVLKYSLRECYRMLSMIVGQEERQY